MFPLLCACAIFVRHDPICYLHNILVMDLLFFSYGFQLLFTQRSSYGVLMFLSYGFYMVISTMNLSLLLRLIGHFIYTSAN
jgi:hypothetical protein